MPASVPLMVLPLTVTALPGAAFLSLNTPLAAPPSVTTSLPRATIVAVPVRVAAVVASYTLLPAVSPETARLAGVMLAVVV